MTDDAKRREQAQVVEEIAKTLHEAWRVGPWELATETERGWRRIEALAVYQLIERKGRE